MWRGRRPCAGFPSPRSPGRPSVFRSRLPGPETLPFASRERWIASKGPCRLRSPAVSNGYPRRGERSGAAVPDVARGGRVRFRRSDVRVDSFRLLAGKADVRGDGDVSIAGESLRLRGSLSLPAGRRPTTASANHSPGKKSPGSGKSPAPGPACTETRLFPRLRSPFERSPPFRWR